MVWAGLAVVCAGQSQPVVSQPAESQPASAPSNQAEPARPRVAMEIECDGEDWGRIVLELYPDKARVTVDNFLRYVDEGFYDGTIFHRVIPTFLIQGGGYTSLTEPKKTGLGLPIRNEARTGLKNTRYTIAMARARHPTSATSQFFINLDDNSKLDWPGQDGSGYCAFGRVVEGFEVVDRIEQVKTQPHPTMNADTTPSAPIVPPVIKRAYQVDEHGVARPPRTRRPMTQPVREPEAGPQQPQAESPDTEESEIPE